MKVLVLTDDVVGPAMAGSAVRAWELGRVLAGAGHEVRVAGGPGSRRPDPGGPEVTVDASWSWADAVIAAPWSLPPRAFVGRHLLVADVITPLLAELDQMPDAPHVVARRRTARARLPLVAARADALLAGGPAQIEWWTERLHGRLGLPVVTVPFGVPEEVPPAERASLAGVPNDWAVVLWWGGVWPWLDLDTLLEARARLERAPVSLVVPIAPRPGAAAFGWTRGDLDRALARHRLQPPQVVALDRWVPYRERHAVLNRASLLAVLHHTGDEAAMSFRTRALDGVWAGVPLLLSEGGEVSRLARQHGWGGVVPPGDAAAAAAAIELLLSDREQARCRLNLARSRPDWTWEQVAQPLLDVLPELPRVRRGSLVAAGLRSGLALAGARLARSTS